MQILLAYQKRKILNQFQKTRIIKKKFKFLIVKFPIVTQKKSNI